MTFHEWAVANGLTMQQIRSYQAAFGTYDDVPHPEPGLSEAAVQKRVQVKASKLGGRLWPNMKGAGLMADGTFLRWGLLNQSQRISDEIKSHDLIGIRPRLITPEMVGSTLGQFWTREVKKADWHWTGDSHELAQSKFGELILALGGDSGFINNEGQLT